MGDREFPNAREAVEYLEGRVAEMRINDRRQKIQDDLQLIRNRRDHEIVIPLPPGHDQEMWFEKLEANGIWERVFEFVTTPSDVTSAYFACDLFKKHLEEKRMKMLLPKALAVLRDFEHLQYHPKGGIFITFEDFMENRDVLNLRLVCKMWKKSVDHQLLTPLEFSDPDWYLKRKINPNVIVWDLWNNAQCNFNGMEDVDMAMKALGASKSSPSLTRTMALNLFGMEATDANVENSFFSKVLQFLDAHGDAVWGFKCIWLNKSNYEVLCNFVSRMPHLKALKLNTSWFDDSTEAPFAQIPFPSVPSLELSEFQRSTSIGSDDLLITEILGKNLNLKAVCFIYKNFVPQPFPDFVWIALSNLGLEHFSLSLDEHAEIAILNQGSVFMEQLLRGVRGMVWPLKDFRIVYKGPSQLRLGAFLGVLNRFNQSLEEVGVTCVQEPFFDSDDGCVVADCPNLRKIKFL